MGESRQNILDLALELNTKLTDSKGPDSQSGESVLLFIGSKSVGKSSLINLLQDKDEVPKSTLALDYNFIRRSGKSLFKDVCHIWELGGGTVFSNLISIPIKNIGNLKKMTVVLLVDLSRPQQIWLTLEHFITKLSQVFSQHATEKNAEDLASKAWERLGNMEHHQDKSSIQPFPVPLVIVGGKYDIFQHCDSKDKNLVCQTLRSVAHGHGATLLYYSLKEQVLCKRAKDILIQLAFTSTHSNKHLSQDYAKPLFVPAGADSFQQIGGGPPPTSGGLSVAMQIWKHNFISQFPQDGENNIIPEDPAKDKNFEEHAIDTLRFQKHDEFDKYQWEMN